MENLVLYFFLLILRILLDFSPNAGYKRYKFSKTLSEEAFKFVLSKRDSTVVFNLSLVLLPVEVDLIVKEQNHKKDIFGVCGIGCIEIIFALLTKIVVLYI